MNLIFRLFAFGLILSCSSQENKNIYSCGPSISAFEAASNNKELKWEILDSKENLIDYINSNFKFSDTLDVSFCKKNMFFDFTYEVNHLGKICNIEIERKFNLNHFLEIKKFFESIPPLNKAYLHKDKTYRYWIRISANIKLIKD